MKKILLIRHVQTEGNKEKRYIGKMNSPISAYGKKQLDELKKYFKDKKIDRVYSSPSERAQITAHSFFDKIIINNNLREIDFGKFDGMTYEEIKSTYPDFKYVSSDGSDDFSFPEGDSLTSFHDRVSRGFHEILDSMHEDETVAIVSHGGVVRMLLSDIISKNKEQFWRFSIDNASISVISIENEFAVIESLNKKLDEIYESRM